MLAKLAKSSLPTFMYTGAVKWLKACHGDSGPQFLANVFCLTFETKNQNDVENGQQQPLDREPWSRGYGRRLMSWKSWVQIPALCTVWTFFRYICCKMYNICLKRRKKWKRGRGWPIFFKKRNIYIKLLEFKDSLPLVVSPLLVLVPRPCDRAWG